MAKQEPYDSSVSEVNKGIFMDCDPAAQPKGTRRFTLNAINSVIDGKNKLSNEPSNYACSNFTSGFTPIGNVYIGDNNSVVILTNSVTGQDEIGIIDKNDSYLAIVDTYVLQLDVAHQCDIIFRIRKGKERVIYWVDGKNLIRTFNLDRPQNFYSNDYTLYLKANGDPNTYVGDKWDLNSFNLVKTYSKIPFFSSPIIIETGNMLAGSYNFAVQLVDEDLNPTTWITTSNTINVFNDTTNNSYFKIRGSKNITSSAQSFPRTNKSIKLTISNLDQSFPYYRVAIIRAASITGEVDKVLVSDLYSTYDSNFTYSGNDSELTETALESIVIDNEVIYAPQHIEQEENRLIVANTKGKSVDWCDFQTFASSIRTDLVTQQVILNDINSEPNIKNANSTFIDRGYMPGEVASVGIVYLFDDGALSPTFHIPGKSSTDILSSMKVYELDSSYLDVHDCVTNNYWGVDCNNDRLIGKAVRHHRFPFRHEVNKPLVTTTTSTTNITKYRLKLVITLNPAYTPSPSYPDNGAVPPIPLIIPYVFNYQVTGAGSPFPVIGQLTEDYVTGSKDIILYDDSRPLSLISGFYSQLDATSNLHTYQPGTNNRFVITETYDTHIVSSTDNSDIAEVFGLSFSGITRPREDVVGFFIVRNERTDDDRLIIDNAIIGSTTKNEQYISFGLLMPKQYYTVASGAFTDSSGKTLLYDNKSMWFFNPEFQFLNKKSQFDNFVVDGTYTQTSTDMPSISDTDGSIYNSGGGMGVLIQDVQAGTSYNPAINKAKNKDDDGFDLLIGYRNNNIVYSSLNAGLLLPEKTNVLYINAASYQNVDSISYYNVSVDNKVGMYLSDTTYDTNILTNTDGSNGNALLYAAMVKNNTNAYSNFLTRPYYKEHNNPVMFGSLEVVNDFEVYNGDAQISALNLVSTVFYNIVVGHRPKKNGLWKIIVGAILVAASVVAIATGVFAPLGAAGLAAATSISTLAISYGVSLAISGIKFEQFKDMIQTDYEKGLKDTVTDGGVFQTIREAVETEDDNIRWFADRVSNIYIESSIPFGLRVGLTSGVSDFVDAPQPYSEPEFRTYLTEKLTTLDRDQGAGRLYKGYAGAEFYDINMDYMRFNKQKIFFHLPVEYDCCSDYKEEYPLRRWYSQQSFQEEKIDNYRVFLPNNYSDIEGEHGEITGLYRLKNNLYIHTKECLWQQPANLQERVTDEIISFIGTGSFLEIPPRKVQDSTLGSGGTKHKWATVKTKIGVFSVSELENSIYLHIETNNYSRQESLKYINDGVTSYFSENLKAFLDAQMYSTFGIEFKNVNNPANPSGIGYISAHDTKYDRVIFAKKDFLILPDKLALLQIVNSIPLTDDGVFYYNTDNGVFYIGITPIPFQNKDYFENKSFTFSYSMTTGAWLSWHNYLPSFFITGRNTLYSCVDGDTTLWKHNQVGSYGSFYGVQYQFIVERVAIANPVMGASYEDMVIQTDARQWNEATKDFIYLRYSTFNKVLLYNNLQSSNELQLVVKQTNSDTADWYSNQIKTSSGSIIISKEGDDWNLNAFRDLVVDYNQSLFSSDWQDTKDRYYIDKVINPQSTSISKNWFDRTTFSGKFVVIRLIFDNFNGINLGINYSIDTQEISS